MNDDSDARVLWVAIDSMYRRAFGCRNVAVDAEHAGSMIYVLPGFASEGQRHKTPAAGNTLLPLMSSR
jgi:hypothetical protein